MSVRIAIIDSGINVEQLYTNKTKVEHINLRKVRDYNSDCQGHGTAVAFLITRQIQDAKIYSLKIFNDGYNTKEKDFIDALRFIYENLEVDIINISSGVVVLKHGKELEDYCEKLSDKGIIIVAAFANQGIKTYPASFDSVIGVYWSTHCINPKEFIFVEESPINIMGYGGKFKMPWLEGRNDSVAGASFTSAIISNKIAKYIQEYGNLRKEQLFQLLKENAIRTESFRRVNNKQEYLSNLGKGISRAILLFPNKELHAVIGNMDLLTFDIYGVYDYRLSQNIGKNTSEYVYGEHVYDADILDMDKIVWESKNFDTVIVGHTKQINDMLRIDVLEQIIEKCLKYGKNIYSFDCLQQYDETKKLLREKGNFAIDFSFNKEDVVDNTFGSLNKFSFPVLAVVGTSSKQGKYNIQLALRRRFNKKNLNIGQLGTEPTGVLFGFDIIYTYGYGSSTALKQEDEVYYINNAISCMGNKDLLLVGTQSNTIPYSFGNIFFYPFTTEHILMACEPDAVVLAINYTDPIGYIMRNIIYLENYYGSKVIALVLYPYIKGFQNSIKGENIRKLTKNEILQYKDKLQKITSKKVYLNGSSNDMDELMGDILNYFT